MKKSSLALIILSFLLILSCKGDQRKAGSVDIMHLRGNFREMGRQYGSLQKVKLKEFHADMKKLFIAGRGIPAGKMHRFALDLFDSYPQRFREILLGMAETSGLSLEEHLFINAFEHFLFHPDFAGDSASACSGIAAWGPYTAGGSLIFGRNYDFGADVSAFGKYLCIAVFNPEGSGLATAVITYTGTLNATTLMNSAGIFLELNNGGVSAGGITFTGRVSTPVELLAIMLDSSTLAQIDREMHTKNTQFPYIINTADKDAAFSYEWAPFGVKRISGKGGLLVSTNHFTGDWGLPKSSDSFFLTRTRHSNLCSLAESSKGSIDIAKMKKILGTGIRDGGATSYRIETIEGKPAPYTAYQVIAEPGQKRLWIRVTGLQDWTAVELDNFFKGK